MNNIAQPVNRVAQAYESRTGQLEAQREKDQAKAAAAQQQRDNDMLKVFEFAGDGRTDEAKYLAQAKGLEVPDQIYSNGDFAKGLATAGKFYGDDSAGAQRFAMAWMQTQDVPDYAQRVIRASQLAGQPIDPDDRKFQREIELERFKHGLKKGDARTDLFIDATKESLGGFTPDPNAGRIAVEQYDQFFGAPTSPVSPNLTGGYPMQSGQAPLNVRNNNPGNMRPVGATSGFQQFGSPQEGIQAMRNDLAAKISGQSQAMRQRYGNNYTPTLAAVISTWAPPEENDTMAYVNYVSQTTGIAPNQPLSEQDIDRIMPAIIQMEGGQQATNYYDSSGQQVQGQQTAVIEGQTATNPQTGEKIVYRGGQWVAYDQQPVLPTQSTAPVQFVQNSGQGYDPNTGYFSSVPQDTRFDTISKNLANFTNIPAHIRNTINAGGSALGSGANFIKKTAVNTAEGVGEYLGESPYVMVTSPNGESGYILRNQLQQAISQGYKEGFDDGIPSPPISQ